MQGKWFYNNPNMRGASAGNALQERPLKTHELPYERVKAFFALANVDKTLLNWLVNMQVMDKEILQNEGKMQIRLHMVGDDMQTGLECNQNIVLSQISERNITLGSAFLSSGGTKFPDEYIAKIGGRNSRVMKDIERMLIACRFDGVNWAMTELAISLILASASRANQFNGVGPERNLNLGTMQEPIVLNKNNVVWILNESLRVLRTNRQNLKDIGYVAPLELSTLLMASTTVNSSASSFFSLSNLVASGQNGTSVFKTNFGGGCDLIATEYCPKHYLGDGKWLYEILLGPKHGLVGGMYVEEYKPFADHLVGPTFATANAMSIRYGLGMLNPNNYAIMRVVINKDY